MTEAQQRRRPLLHVLRVVVVLAVVVVGMVVWYRLTNSTSAAPAAAPAAPAAPAAASSAPAAAAGTIEDGVWIVGVDVQPGTYRSAGAVDGDYCMWSRHSSLEGGPMDAIIASDGSYQGQMLVTIAATDKVFRTHGCAPFQRVQAG